MMRLYTLSAHRARELGRELWAARMAIDDLEGTHTQCLGRYPAACVWGGKLRVTCVEFIVFKVQFFEGSQLSEAIQAATGGPTQAHVCYAAVCAADA